MLFFNKHKITALVAGVFDDIVFRNLLGGPGDAFPDLVVEQLLGGECGHTRIPQGVDEGAGEDRMTTTATSFIISKAPMTISISSSSTR